MAARVRDGEPCPYCGTPAATIVRINELRERHGETQLVAEVERLTVALAQAEGELRQLRAVIFAVRNVLPVDEP